MKKLVSALVFLFVSFWFTNVSASHIIGHDMNWRDLGNDSFLISVQLYRDCNGIGKNFTTSIKTTSSCRTFNSILNVDNVNRDITPVCKEQCTNCSNSSCSFKYGISIYTGYVLVVLDEERKNNCCWVNISFSNCCLIGRYTNISSSPNFYSDIKLNVCESSGLESPEFDIAPVRFACLGRDVKGSLWPSNMDSAQSQSTFTFSFDTIRSAKNNYIFQNSPYLFNMPLNHYGFPNNNSDPRGFNLDSTTGALRFRPMREGMYAYAIKIEQRHKGKLIGVTSRFLSEIVIKCPVNAPKIAFSSKTSLHASSLQIGNTIKQFVHLGEHYRDGFRVIYSIYDSLTPLRVFPELNKGMKVFIDSQTFSKNATNQYVELDFSVDSTHYEVGDTIIGSIGFVGAACPFTKYAKMHFQFIVVPDSLDYGGIQHTITDSICGRYVFHVPYIKETQETIWLINGKVKRITSRKDSIFAVIPETRDTQFIEVRRRIGGAKPYILINRDTIVPTFVENIKIKSIVDTSFCLGGEYKTKLQLDDPNRTVLITWSYNGSPLDSSRLVSFTPVAGRNYFTTYVTDSATKCRISTARVEFNAKPIIDNHHNFPIKQFCTDDSFSFQLPKGSGLKGSWSGPGINKNRFYRDTLKDGIYDLTYRFEGARNCFIRHQKVAFSKTNLLQIDTGINVCNDEELFTLNSNRADVFWYGPGVINDSSFQLKNTNDTTVKVYAVYSNIAGCIDTDSMNIHIGARKKGRIIPPNDTAVCVTKNNLFLDFKNLGNGYWSKPIGVINELPHGYVLNVASLKQGMHVITFTGSDMWGCKDTASFNMTKDSLDKVYSSNVPLTGCANRDSFKLITKPSADYWTGKGVVQLGSDYYFHADKGTLKDNKLEAVIIDQYGCHDVTEFNYIAKPYYHVASHVDTICEGLTRYLLPKVLNMPGNWKAQPHLYIPGDEIQFNTWTTGTFNISRRFTNKDSSENCLDVGKITLVIVKNPLPRKVGLDTIVCASDSLVKLRKYPKHITTWTGGAVEKIGSDYYLRVEKELTATWKAVLNLVGSTGHCFRQYSNLVKAHDTFVRTYNIQDTICSTTKKYNFPLPYAYGKQRIYGYWRVLEGTADIGNYSSYATLTVNPKDTGMNIIHFEQLASTKDDYPCLLLDTSRIFVRRRPKIYNYVTNQKICLDTGRYYFNSHSLIFKGNSYLDSFNGEYFVNTDDVVGKRIRLDIIKTGFNCPERKVSYFDFKKHPQLKDEPDQYFCRPKDEDFLLELNNTKGTWEGFGIIEGTNKANIQSNTIAGVLHYTYKETNDICAAKTSMTLTIAEKPVAEFKISSDSGEVPFVVHFDFGLDDVRGKRFIWDFGTGDTLYGRSDQVYTYTEPGTYTAKLLAESTMQGCSDSMTATIIAYIKQPDGLREKENLGLVSIYPNPASRTLTIELLNSEFNSLRIYSTNGQLLKTEKIVDKKIIHLNIDHLQAGSYLLELVGSGESVTKTFIKK